MALRRIMDALAMGSLCATFALAGPPEPDAADSIRSGSPSTNQSLSLEQVAVRQPPEKEPDIDHSQAPLGPVETAQALRQETSVSASEGTPAFRSPAAFGKKRHLVDTGGTGLGSQQVAPWYRTSFGALGLVLAIIGIFYLVVRRWFPRAAMRDDGLVQIVARTVVGPRQSLLLVRLGGRMVLVGVSPDRIDRVCEVQDADEVESLSAKAGAGKSGGFSAWLDHEAAEYADSPMGSAKDVLRDGPRRSSPGPLTDLLHKLRSTKV